MTGSNTRLSTTWNSGGIERTFTTAQNPGESQQDWIARHNADVASMQQEFPIDA